MSASPHLFILGRTPDLAFLELARFFPDAKRILPDVARVETHETKTYQSALGGTVKIAREVGIVGNLSSESLLPLVAPGRTSLHMGISGYGTDIPSALLPAMKKMLEAQGVRVRYATAKHGSVLSSVTVDKSGITEWVIVKYADAYIVGQTISVQDYEAWNKRDYGRPFSDAKSGMLPPKVARMIVNIAMSSESKVKSLPAGEAGQKSMILLDPFCGMGTILAEAWMSGWKVMGTDISAETVRKAKANLDWLGAAASVSVCDATHVSEIMPPQSIDAIVTEPFMGNARFQKSDIKNLMKGLEKLYIGCLREWARVLVPGGKVVIALPEYSFGGRVYFVGKVIDMCETLGYTTQAGPIEYGRPGATVKRLFYIFKKK